MLFQILASKITSLELFQLASHIAGSSLTNSVRFSRISSHNTLLGTMTSIEYTVSNKQVKFGQETCLEESMVVVLQPSIFDTAEVNVV